MLAVSCSPVPSVFFCLHFAPALTNLDKHQTNKGVSAIGAPPSYLFCLSCSGTLTRANRNALKTAYDKAHSFVEADFYPEICEVYNIRNKRRVPIDSLPRPPSHPRSASRSCQLPENMKANRLLMFFLRHGRREARHTLILHGSRNNKPGLWPAGDMRSSGVKQGNFTTSAPIHTTNPPEVGVRSLPFSAVHATYAGCGRL